MNVLLFDFLKNEKGAAAVEFAVILPLLSLILFGLMAFGIVFHDYLEITHAAREGVRWAALEEPYSVVLDKAKKAAPGIDWNQASLSMLDENGNSITQATINDQGDPVTVKVSYNLPLIVTDLNNAIKGIINVFVGGVNSPLPNQLSSTAVQRIE